MLVSHYREIFRREVLYELTKAVTIRIFSMTSATLTFNLGDTIGKVVPLGCTSPVRESYSIGQLIRTSAGGSDRSGSLTKVGLIASSC